MIYKKIKMGLDAPYYHKYKDVDIFWTFDFS